MAATIRTGPTFANVRELWATWLPSRQRAGRTLKGALPDQLEGYCDPETALEVVS